ncbi:MAG: type II toxin-antitoxin system prevent-host-death family antitoxin, partial [Spirochaetes bacterium]|nr:type II toxin-antitoxin system prevent-host-death family antitoxin [Spirochaetota bacterium]
IKNNIPFGINDYIYQELLQGSKTEKEFSILNDYLKTQRFYYLLYGRQSYENASLIYFNCRRNGITLRSTIDLLIVETAIENNLKLLHIDNDFYNIGKIIKLIMKTIAVSDFRAHIQKFLNYVKHGEELVITIKGKKIAKIIPTENKQKLAKERLKIIAKNSQINNIIDPININWKLH